MKLIGAFTAILIGSLGGAIDAGFHPVSHGSIRPPVLPQISLPLVASSGPSAAAPVFTLVQQAVVFSSALGSALQVTLGSAPTSGNTLVFCETNANQRTITGVTNAGTGAVYTSMGTEILTVSSAIVELGAANVGTGATIGVAVNYAAAGGSRAMNVSEWSSNLTQTKDGTAGVATAASSATVTSGAYSTTLSNDLVLFCIGTSSAIASASTPSGYTALTLENASFSVAPFYVNPGTNGAQSATSTLGGTAGSWGSILVGIKHT